VFFTKTCEWDGLGNTLNSWGDKSSDEFGLLEKVTSSMAMSDKSVVQLFPITQIHRLIYPPRNLAYFPIHPIRRFS